MGNIMDRSWCQQIINHISDARIIMNNLPVFSLIPKHLSAKCWDIWFLIFWCCPHIISRHVKQNMERREQQNTLLSTMTQRNKMIICFFSWLFAVKIASLAAGGSREKTSFNYDKLLLIYTFKTILPTKKV